MSSDDTDSELDEHDLESEISSDEDEDDDVENENEEDAEDEDMDEVVVDWKLLYNQNSVAPDRFPYIANSGTKVLRDELDVVQYFYTFF